jgi:hypothetical protein
MGYLYSEDHGINKKFCSETQKGTEHLENLGVGGRIILKWIIKRM